MRTVQVLLIICLFSLFLVSCTGAKKNSQEQSLDASATSNSLGNVTLEPEQIFQIETTSTLDEVMTYLQNHMGITPVLQDEEGQTILRLKDFEAFDQTLDGVLLFKEDTTFMELFSMYDVYQLEYEEIRKRYYKEKHGIDSMEEFYDLPLKEQEKIDHYLAEYVDKDSTWNRLKKKYAAIEEKYNEKVLEYPDNLYIKAEFMFNEPLNEKEMKEIYAGLSKNLGNDEKALSSNDFHIWNKEKHVIIYDCTRPVHKKKELRECMIFTMPNVNYMNEFLDLNINF